MIRIVIADDHRLMREGVKALLSKAEDIQVVGEAEDGLEAVDLALRVKPDVVLMDASMPTLSGFRAAEQIRALESNVKVLFLSGYSTEPLLRQALRSGGQGYILKDSSPQELALAIRAVHRGEFYFSPEVFSYLSEELLHR
jgi:DNA-binding NarL/FixJ family response regulator